MLFRELCVIGAGGHGKVVIDALTGASRSFVLCDNDEDRVGSFVLGHEVRRPPEVGDLLAVPRWLMNEHGAQASLCAGYSFGAHVLWHALPLLSAKRVLLIAPPTAAHKMAIRTTATMRRLHGSGSLWNCSVA